MNQQRNRAATGPCLSVMPISNPTALVEEFKRSGEFDRLRREVLAQFQQDESYPAFKEGIENLARNRLTDDLMLSADPDFIMKELTQEIQRYPVVERAVTNVRTFSDPEFLTNMQKFMEKILHDEKNGKPSSSSPSKGTKIENRRTESLENSTSQLQNIPPKTPQGNDAQGPLVGAAASGSSGVLPTLVTTTSEPLLSDIHLTNVAPEKVAQEENVPKPDGLSTAHDVHVPAANNTLSGPPSFSATSIPNPKAITSNDDHQATIADVEMEDATSAP